MAERDIQREIMLACCRGRVRLFRNNVGTGWTGDALHIARNGTVGVKRGDVLIRQARPLHAGLCEGSSDLIGWASVTITPEMAGQTVAVFLAPEVKTDRGYPSESQRRFLDAVNAAGGRAGIVRSVADAQRLIGLAGMPAAGHEK